MLKEALTMKVNEESPLTKLIESENFNKEELKEKLFETLVRKSVTSYSLFEKLLEKYNQELKEIFKTPSDIINQLVFHFGHNEIRLRHYVTFLLDKEFFGFSDVYETLALIESPFESLIEVYKLIFIKIVNTLIGLEL